MTTFVTGATGHLGACLVRALVARGERVRALVLPGSDSAAIDGLGLERVEGDVRDPRSLADAITGCDRVYHLAACLSLRRRDRQKLFEVNVLGTRNVLETARRSGVRRVVHCSSFGAVGRNPHGASDERWTLNPFDPVMDYELSKALAEQEVLRAVQRGLEVTWINPSGIVGPWDFKPSLLGQMIREAARGRLPAYVSGAYDFVPARDVVAGLTLAMERGRTGERYLITGEVVSLKQMLVWIEEWTGARRARIALPVRAAIPMAVIKDEIQAILFPSVHPRFTAASLRLLATPKRGDSRKAVRELGWRGSPLREAVREAAAWFVDRSAGLD